MVHVRSSTTRLRWVAVSGVLAFVLAGCGSSSEDSEPDAAVSTAESGSTTVAAEPSSAAEETSATEEESETPVEETAAAQEETCDWDSPALKGSGQAPQGRAGDLPSVLVGAWQHTHFDTGSGYEPVTQDIRFVFPSTDRILYCQHVPGVTDHAENAADFALNGTSIDLPGAPGYDVSAWSADAMVWLNRADGSRYLLHRR